MSEQSQGDLFTYHLIKLPFFAALKHMLSPIKATNIQGLLHAETMSAMQLGSSVFAPTRLFSSTIVVFAQWKDEDVLQTFLQTHKFGRLLATGWYVKLKFVRQNGAISRFKIPNIDEIKLAENQPVVAVTLARMRYTEIPRFLRWGIPVEKQVRDHAGTTLSLASISYPNLISTFSIWKTSKEMTDMVFGHSKMPQPKRHIHAMNERDKRDFHFEFTALRFLPLAEYGTWNGKSNYLIQTDTD